jgi:hypothetical protein
MPSGAAIDNTMGAYLIALLLSTTVYGVTCLQVYTYLTESMVQDPLVLKTFVRDFFLPPWVYRPDINRTQCRSGS